MKRSDFLGRILALGTGTVAAHAGVLPASAQVPSGPMLVPSAHSYTFDLLAERDYQKGKAASHAFVPLAEIRSEHLRALFLQYAEASTPPLREIAHNRLVSELKGLAADNGDTRLRKDVLGKLFYQAYALAVADASPTAREEGIDLLAHLRAFCPPLAEISYIVDPEPGAQALSWRTALKTGIGPAPERRGWSDAMLEAMDKKVEELAPGTNTPSPRPAFPAR